jgi:uncharacterized protein (DUF1499 family)
MHQKEEIQLSHLQNIFVGYAKHVFVAVLRTSACCTSPIVVASEKARSVPLFAPRTFFFETQNI